MIPEQVLVFDCDSIHTPSNPPFKNILLWVLIHSQGCRVITCNSKTFSSSIWEVIANASQPLTVTSHYRKRSVFITNPKKGNAKEYSNCCTIALISHASKLMLKILQASLQKYVNQELTDVQAGFRKGRGTRDQIADICWLIEKPRQFQKNIYFCFIDYAKTFGCFDCVDHNKL